MSKQKHEEVKKEKFSTMIYKQSYPFNLPSAKRLQLTTVSSADLRKMCKDDRGLKIYLIRRSVRSRLLKETVEIR